MFMLITYITCFAIYLGTQQCKKNYFRGNNSSFMTENNSSRFFLDALRVKSRIRDVMNLTYDVIGVTLHHL